MLRSTVLALAASFALATLPAGAPAATAPLRSCGDLDVGGLLIADISARRVSCTTARRVARDVPRRCASTGFCRVRGLGCLTARATRELRFARCSTARGANELYRTVRFDYGS